MNEKETSSFDELIKALEIYKTKGTFMFEKDSTLSSVCSIPKNDKLSGLYLFYNMDTRELLYIGISGRTDQTGVLYIGQMAYGEDFLKENSLVILEKKRYHIKCK